MTFDQYLRERIRRLETNTKALARALGVPQPTMQHWVTGTKVPPAYTQRWIREKIDGATEEETSTDKYIVDPIDWRPPT